MGAEFDEQREQFSRHAQTGEVVVRECASVEEYDACVRLQREVFRLSDMELSPRRHFIVTRQAGGWTLGAFDRDELIGFVHQMSGARGREVIGYSHMMAVRADYQNKGVGARLKWAQRARALSEGQTYITWTWEPVRARNAHFNINRLGVLVRRYGVNFYGTDYVTAPESAAQTEPAGIDSDRLFADWELRSPRVESRARGEQPTETRAHVAAIEIPPDWSALLKQDPQRARREQLRVREEFQRAFADKLVCAGFDRDPSRPRYLLFREA